MRFWTSLSIASAACLLACSTTAFAEAEEKSDVIAINNAETFDKEIKDAKLVLVKFFSPWCGHCQALAPKFEQAATELKDKDIKLAEVDCTVYEESCKTNDIRGYPTLKVFRYGNSKLYRGTRSVEGIVEYMRMQALPDLSILTAKTIDEFKDSGKVVVIGFFNDDKSAAYKELKAVATKLRDDYIFGASLDADIAKKFKVTVPGLILFKKFDEGKDVFDKATKFTAETITAFVKKSSVPIMAELSSENYSFYLQAPIPLAYFYYSSEKEREVTGAQVEAVAKEFRGKLNFVYVDSVKYEGEMEELNLNQTFPAFAIKDNVAETKFPFDQSKKITKEAIREFVQAQLDGKLKPSIKSEPIPKSNDGPVKIVVSDSFNDIVKDTKKDVLIEFYAPWCGHCKKLAPTYEQLAAMYPEESNIVIAKMDATANDLPLDAGFSVNGFPTIKFFKAGSNEMVNFSGDRSLESFKEFLKNNTKSQYEPVGSTDNKNAPSEESSSHDEL